MNLARVVLAVSILATTLSCAKCDVAPIGRLAPIAAIGDPFDPTFSICTSGDDKYLWRDCAFNFGEINVGSARVFSFTVKNPSQATLTIEGIDFAAGSDPAFAIDGVKPTTVVPAIGAIGEIVSVKFTPAVEGPVTATLRIKSDGENLVDDEDIVINLTASGVSRCAPDIDVQPANCDFREVGVNARGFCDITINNNCTSSCELLISDLGFTGDAVFGTEPVSVPFSIPCGTGRTMRLYAQPTSANTFNGALTISSFDPDEPVTTVPLTVTGAEAPTCVARVSRINNIPNSPTNPTSPEVEPLDDVEVSADLSTAASPGGTITGWEWSILNKPVESRIEPSTPTLQNTRFRFSSGVGTVSGLDVIGTYVMSVIVTDSTGARSTPCTVAINAVPRSGIAVQLTWDEADGDIDLHLVKNSTDWCRNDDCYYGRTTTSWGGSLDIDDLRGFGPETITVDTPGDGRYTVGVGVYSGGRPTNATVKIFIGGQLEYESVRFLSGGKPWLPARVVISGGVSTVEVIETQSQQSGSCWGQAG